jgi:hypothetical protein
MKFTAAFHALRIDTDKYRRALDKCLREALAQSLAEWLQTTVMTEVPVWSGASRATFLALAGCIHYDIPISPEVPSRIGHGMDESTGELVIDEGRGQYTFRYSTTLPWLIINEYFDATQWGFHLRKPGPYDFQAKGQAAFRESAANVRLPSPFTCLKTAPIKAR